MKKVAIVTDSNSGITLNDNIEGLFVIPMPFNIDNETYYEEKNLTYEQFYSYMDEGKEIFTSQPFPNEITSLWDEILTEYDELVHIPMSSGLSGSYNTARMLSKDYGDKVWVADNKRISVPMRESVMDALTLAKKGMSASRIMEILEEDGLNASIYIMIGDLYYLKKGGRITKTAASLGSILNIKPVLQIQGDKLDAFAKVRTYNKGIEKMLQAVDDDIKNRFGGEYDKDKITFGIAYTKKNEMVDYLKEQLYNKYPDCKIQIQPLSLSIVCHTGPDALGVCCSRVLDFENLK